MLAALVVAAYGPALRADFVNWDDPNHVYENPRVTAPDALWRSLSDGSVPGFYPVLYGFYRFEWHAGGRRPWLFHLDNVLLHAANAVLVGLLMHALAMPALASWLAAGLWALHPAHVESVAWITERKNVLYTFFWLASLLAYVRARRAKTGHAALAGAVSLLLFTCSMLSKAAAISLPAAFVLIEWGSGRRLDRRFWLSLVPYVALAVLGGVELTHLVPATISGPHLGVRLTVACRTFWTYVWSFLWPHELVPVYPKWSLHHADFHDLLAAFGVVGLAASGVLAGARLPRTVLVGAGLFVTNIFLVLGVVWNSYMEYAFTADRYLYLPAVGLAMAAVAGLDALARAAGVPARVPSVAVALWCGVLGFATWRQVPVWHDSETLWHYTLSHNPDCLPCEQNLGSLRLAQGRLEEAAELFERARQLNPKDRKHAYNLGVVRQRQGRLEEATARYREAVELDPTWPDAHNNLGAMLFDAGRTEEARQQFEETLRFHPGDFEAELNLGLVAADGEDWEAAEQHDRRALASATDDRQSAEAHRKLAKVLETRTKLGEAIVHYQAALRLTPDDEDALAALAWIRATNADARWRDGAEAVRLGERLCAVTKNRDADALDTLAAAYAEAGRFDDAVRTGRKALAAAEAGSEMTEEITHRLALYEARQPYRAP